MEKLKDFAAFAALIGMMAFFYFYIFVVEPILDNILRPIGRWLYPSMRG